MTNSKIRGSFLKKNQDHSWFVINLSKYLAIYLKTNLLLEAVTIIVKFRFGPEVQSSGYRRNDKSRSSIKPSQCNMLDWIKSFCNECEGIC